MPETKTRVPSFAFSQRIVDVRSWAERKLGTLRHERRVAGIALRLFDLTAPHHGLDLHHRRLLKLGSLLHDVGRSEGARRHHINGARMILGRSSLPLTSAERRAAAYLCRYHRKALPRRGERTILRPADDGRAMRLLLAILRAADALDSRRVCTSALTLRLRGRQLIIHCYVYGSWRDAERAYAKRRKFRLLRELLGISVKFHVMHADEAVR